MEMNRLERIEPARLSDALSISQREIEVKESLSDAFMRDTLGERFCCCQYCENFWQASRLCERKSIVMMAETELKWERVWLLKRSEVASAF